MGFPIDNNMIFYYNQESDLYIFCGYDPIPPFITIALEEFQIGNIYELKIKCSKT